VKTETAEAALDGRKAMDGPTAQYLHPIAGLDAALWVPPSRGQLFFTVDEIVASPRLLPVLLLELLWLLGHDPGRRAAWRALSARAIASGNPALDYIGTGGPTPMRLLAWPDRPRDQPA
jgi:hypothetical protein